MTNKPLDEPKTRVLKNGAIYDLTRGRIVTVRPELAEKNTQITKANSGEMQARNQERKRNTIRAAANAAVERQDYRNLYGDQAFVAAIAETAYLKATTPDDPKAIDAARFLLTESGLADKQGADAQPPHSLADQAIVGLIQAITRKLGADDVIPMRSDLEQGDE